MAPTFTAVTAREASATNEKVNNLAPDTTAESPAANIDAEINRECMAKFGGEWMPGVIAGYDSQFYRVILSADAGLNICVSRFVPRQLHHPQGCTWRSAGRKTHE